MSFTTLRRVSLAATVLIVVAGTAGAQGVLRSTQSAPALIPDSQVVPQEILGSTPDAPLPNGNYQFSSNSVPSPPPLPGSVGASVTLLPGPTGQSLSGAYAPAVGLGGESPVDSMSDSTWDPVEFPVSYGICSGIVAGADIAFLRAYAGDLRTLNLTVPAAGVALNLPFAENEFDVTPRLWLGWVNSNGLGVRARYWRFQQALEAEQNNFLFAGGAILPAGTVLNSNGGLDMYAVDVEFTQRMDLGLWKANLGAGVRVAEISHRLRATLAVPGFADFIVTDFDRFSGAGPTLFAEFRRPLGDSRLSLVCNGRGSLLFGDWTSDVATNGPLPIGPAIPQFDVHENNDAVVSVAEIQLGLEWTRQLGGGGTFFANVLWEGQIWTGSKSVVQVGNADVALTGVSIGAGITR